MSIGGWLENVLRGMTASATTDIFIIVILAVFVLAIFQGRKGKHDRFLEHAPSVLTSLGILGTFVGIVLGLLDFDSENIEGSISMLLAGLKTAFITSLVGMLLSIILKGLDTWWFAPMRDNAGVPDEVGPSHIHAQLSRQVELLTALEQSIAGQEEGTLVGQIKLLRSDVSDFRSGIVKSNTEFQQKLFVQLNDFANLLAKSATEAVVEALRQVIHDFNKHLVEQFGDNFKALDESVKKMVDWQVSYKEHIERLEARIEDALVALERTRDANEGIAVAVKSSQESVSLISANCKSIPATMDGLRDVMQVNQNQIQELVRHLEAFVAMRDQATQAVPKLQEHMDKLAAGMQTSLQGIMTKMHDGALEFGRHSDRVNSALGESANTISTQSEKMATDLSDASTEFSKSARNTLEVLQRGSADLDKSMQDVVKRASEAMAQELGRAIAQIEVTVTKGVESSLKSMTQAIQLNVADTQQSVQATSSKTLGAVEEQVREVTKRVEQSLNAQLSAFEKSLERELEKVFRDMGSALATISKRIADDHQEFSRRPNS